MSHQATTWVMEFSESKLASRLVLLAIAHRISNDDGDAWPSVVTIQREANLCERQVFQSIKELVENKELEVREEVSEKGTNRYHMPKFLAWYKTIQKKQDNKKVPAQRAPAQYAGAQHAGGTLHGHAGAQHAPEPSLRSKDKPSFKPSEELPSVKDSQEEKASPNYGLFRTRFRSLTGILANTYKDNQAKYEELCRDFGEDAVLEALAEWVKSEGKDEIKKHGKWAAKHFFEEAEILITTSAPEEDDEEDPEASFPHMEGDVDAKEEYYRRFPQYSPEHRMEPPEEEIFEDAGTTPEAKPDKT